ncbi:serine protease [Oceanicella sp. SM1341]|uniref:trypsin-like serine peptidase n=1 Tax=Oceanicella sp. SM1341 TaxID=1548889 RepID=UPI000E5379F3|nr:serine protease [Oceanicella sp. SM1341]
MICRSRPGRRFRPGPRLCGFALLALAACETASIADRPVPPGGSVTPQSLQAATQDRSYFLDHDYVRAAMAHGNQGFAEVMAHRGEAARESFATSTGILVEGVAKHAEYAADRAAEQRLLADLLTVGLGVAGTLAATNAMSSAGSTAQNNAIIGNLSRFMDMNRSMNQMLHSDISAAQAGSSAVRRVDRDRWRAPVVSDHRIARSIVRLHNETRNTLCTGFFVAPYLIATAAHCFRLGEIMAAYRQRPGDGEAFMTNDLQLFTPHLQTQPEPWARQPLGPDHDYSPFDFALLVTNEPSDSYLPVLAREVRPGERLMALGYSGDLNQGFFLQLDYGCEVTSVGEYASFRSNCVTWGGNSGGPVLAIDGEIAVVGVHSNSRRQQNRDENNAGAASVLRGAPLTDHLLVDPNAQGRVTFNPFGGGAAAGGE